MMFFGLTSHMIRWSGSMHELSLFVLHNINQLSDCSKKTLSVWLNNKFILICLINWASTMSMYSVYNECPIVQSIELGCALSWLGDNVSIQLRKISIKQHLEASPSSGNDISMRWNQHAYFLSVLLFFLLIQLISNISKHLHLVATI